MEIFCINVAVVSFVELVPLSEALGKRIGNI